MVQINKNLKKKTIYIFFIAILFSGITIAGQNLSFNEIDDKSPTLQISQTVIEMELSDGSYSAYPRDISVYQNDGYIAGNIYQDSKDIACYWINDIRYDLTVDNANAENTYAESICIDQGDVYIGGYYSISVTNYGGYWINGVFNEISDLSEVISIDIDQGNEYLLGKTTSGWFCYWTNGIVTELSDADGITGLDVSNGDVYVSGFSDNYNPNYYYEPVYWKNGIITRLATETVMDERANDIFIDGNDVYVAGRQYNYGSGYWKNSQWTNVDDNGIINTIFVENGNVYTAGHDSDDNNNENIACFWINGERIALTQGNSVGGTQVHALHVVDGAVHATGDKLSNNLGYVGGYWRYGASIIPEIQILSPNGGEVFSESIEITWSCNIPDARYTISLFRGGEWIVVSNDYLYTTFILNTSMMDYSDCLIRVRAYNNQYDIYDDSDSVFTLDNTAPVINPEGARQSFEAQSGIHYISWTITDDNAPTDELTDAYVIYLDGGIIVSGLNWFSGDSVIWDISNLNPGIHNLKLIVQDKAGNTAQSEITVYVYAYGTGDVNSDGYMDIVDALLTAQYYVGLNPNGFDSTVADVNADGAIDIVDALLIANIYVSNPI